METRSNFLSNYSYVLQHLPLVPKQLFHHCVGIICELNRVFNFCFFRLGYRSVTVERGLFENFSNEKKRNK